MKKKLKWVPVGLLAVFALLQFTNPARTNPPVVHDLAATSPPPAEIATLLRGDGEKISAWSGSGNVRRLGLHVAVIKLKLTYE